METRSLNGARHGASGNVARKLEMRHRLDSLYIQRGVAFMRASERPIDAKPCVMLVENEAYL